MPIEQPESVVSFLLVALFLASLSSFIYGMVMWGRAHVYLKKHHPAVYEEYMDIYRDWRKLRRAQLIGFGILLNPPKSLRDLDDERWRAYTYRARLGWALSIALMVVFVGIHFTSPPPST
jgi:hypothetical protein